MSEEVTGRFEQEDLFLIKEIELLMLNNANETITDITFLTILLIF